MPSKSPFTGTPLGFADTINGAGVPLSGIDCGNGVNAGAKCFVAAGAQYWTLTVSAAAVDHVNVEAALNFPAMRWILDGTPGTGTVANITSTGGTITVTTPTGPTVNVEVTTPAPGFGGAPPAVAAASAGGAAATASRSDHTHQGTKSVTAGTGMTNSGTALDPVLNVTPSGTVTSVASADGSVVITNPTTTPDLSVRVVAPANVAALAALVTVGKFQTGQMAVVGGGLVYTLSAASGTADGSYIVATSDDATKQWRANLYDGGAAGTALAGASRVFTSPEVDLLAIGTTQFFPALTGKFMVTYNIRGVITQLTGVAVGNVTAQAGNNGALSNVWATQAVPTAANINSGVNTLIAPAISSGTGSIITDLATPVSISVTVPTAGATVAKARFFLQAAIFSSL